MTQIAVDVAVKNYTEERQLVREFGFVVGKQVEDLFRRR
jgi:hypothetical protein